MRRVTRSKVLRHLMRGTSCLVGLGVGLGAATALAGTAAAQDPVAAGRRTASLIRPTDGATTDGRRTPAPRARSRRSLQLLDYIVAVIGDSPLLNSEVERDLQTIGGNRSPSQIRAAKDRLIVRKLHGKAFAELGKLVGGDLAPEEFDQRIDAIVDDEIKKAERDARGTAKLQEQLAQVGQSIDDLRDLKRTELLSDLGKRRALWDKIQQNEANLITPREMKRYFDEHRDDFRRPASAVVEVVFVRADRGQSAADFGRAMEEAKKLLEAGTTTVEQLEERFGAISKAYELQQGEAAGADLQDFAFGGDDRAEDRTGRVRLEVGGGSATLFRIARFQPGRDLEFVDPETQSEIRALLRQSRLRELEIQAFNRNATKLLIWPKRIEQRLRDG